MVVDKNINVVYKPTTFQVSRKSATMGINKKLFPVKAHYFFFMSAMGPILPQLPVYGKELGISSVVMGTFTGILPFAFLIAKPLFGMLVDVYRAYRKTIFMVLIGVMTLAYALMHFIPAYPKLDVYIDNMEGVIVDTCKVIDFVKEKECNNATTRVLCSSECFYSGQSQSFLLNLATFSNNTHMYRLCMLNNASLINVNSNGTCNIHCVEDIEVHNGCLYQSSTFWIFITLVSIGTIGFNVVNSISDAICFDVIGEEYDYGKQRVWGAIGFGISALVAGYIVDAFSNGTYTYAPAFAVMVICAVIDLVACIKLKLPVIEAPKNIFRDIKELLKSTRVVTFIIYAVFSGILDSLLIYFLFWYVEDLALQTGTTNVKLLEGLIVAAETLGGEVIFFSLAGKILEKIGHVKCFSMCFINYALRLGLISIVSSPWWILPIEFVFQGPTYALTYTTIVAYANELAPPGASATMQGIAAGMDDGVGYAIGSIVGGFLFKYVGGRNALQIYSVFGVFCGVSHLFIHKTFLRAYESPVENGDYKSPEIAAQVVKTCQEI